MSTKYNTKHESRGQSNYPLRLQDRGISSAQVRMPFFDRNGKRHDTIEDSMRKGGLSSEEG